MSYYTTAKTNSSIFLKEIKNPIQYYNKQEVFWILKLIAVITHLKLSLIQSIKQFFLLKSIFLLFIIRKESHYFKSFLL